MQKDSDQDPACNAFQAGSTQQLKTISKREESDRWSTNSNGLKIYYAEFPNVLMFKICWVLTKQVGEGGGGGGAGECTMRQKRYGFHLNKCNVRSLFYTPFKRTVHPTILKINDCCVTLAISHFLLLPLFLPCLFEKVPWEAQPFILKIARVFSSLERGVMFDSFLMSQKTRMD